MTLAADNVTGSDLRRCGCCGRHLPAGRVAELGVTPGVFICAGCALWAARRAGVGSALRQIPFRSLLPRLRRRRSEHLVRSAIPVLPSADLERTAAFYAPVGFAESERHDGYLLLHSGDVELHFARHDTDTPTGCFVFVADAAKLHEHLRHLGVDGVGPIAEQDYGLREFVLTDPDNNRVRIGSPLT
jgi:hypothetical protein